MIINRDIQGRYIRRYALALALHHRLSAKAHKENIVLGDSATDRRYVGWISGGFKEHWPESVKNRLRRLSRRASHYFDAAFFYRPRYQRIQKLRQLCDAAELAALAVVKDH